MLLDEDILDKPKHVVTILSNKINFSVCSLRFALTSYILHTKGGQKKVKKKNKDNELLLVDLTGQRLRHYIAIFSSEKKPNDKCYSNGSTSYFKSGISLLEYVTVHAHSCTLYACPLV